MEDDARDWYESKIKGKNWELQNILDGVGVATIRLFRAMNNGAIAGLNANQFRGQAFIVHGNAGVVNTIMILDNPLSQMKLYGKKIG